MQRLFLSWKGLAVQEVLVWQPGGYCLLKVVSRFLHDLLAPFSLLEAHSAKIRLRNICTVLVQDCLK